MIDPRREAVLILNRHGRFEDRTAEVTAYRTGEDRTTVTFRGGKSYPYGADKVRVLRDPSATALDADARVEVDGIVWSSAREILTFRSSGSPAWCRVRYSVRGADRFRGYPAEQVKVVTNAARSAGAARILDYWREIISRLPADDDPLAQKARIFDFVSSESALSRYLAGSPIESMPCPERPIFPFRCNLSQREAVRTALSRSISVVEGPPGTGKTETILNLIANIVAVEDKTVGVVSFTNSAVDNVREKLDEAGFGHVLANLGSREKQRGFFADQQERNARVQAFTANVPPPPEPEALSDVDERLRGLQADERARAELRSELSAHELELRHFEQHLRGSELPELERLPLLGRSSARIIDYLAESELEQQGARPGVIRRIWKYFKYGSLRGLDPGDTDVVLRVQRAYYDKRIAELRADIARLDAKLDRADFERLAEEHRELSLRFLRARLGERYRDRSRTIHQAETYRMGREFKDFLRDYPAVLSTCHSLHKSLADGHLLDYLIIDEASQVHPLLAGLAMACCRNLVVVGDQHQLSPIPPEPAKELAAPDPAHHCGERSILTSLMEVYGDELPRTLLREHYRCQPPIIGFCNKKFYDGGLITYTEQRVQRPMTVVRTVEGNHMRQHVEGGRSNRREIDVIEQEVIPRHCGGVAGSDIGITTPYRRQADKAGDALDVSEAATVHKFQGRQKKVVIMSTVLDETWRGRTGLKFVDQRNLINVAVSRAVERFILVTNDDMMPTSRHIKDLVGHIRYQNPDDEVVDSSVISVFDLLYSRYSHRLRALADRVRPVTGHRSEDIAWTALHDVLTEEPYSHLTVVTQVLLKNLFPDTADLTDRQRRYVERRASVDFVLYNRVTNEPVLAVEVDGFAFHENEPAQRERDETEDQIFRTRRLPLLRLPTTGSGEPDRIRAALDSAEPG